MIDYRNFEEDFVEQYRKKSDYERAYIMISSYCLTCIRRKNDSDSTCDTEGLNTLREKFRNWLYSPHNVEAKLEALGKVFLETDIENIEASVELFQMYKMLYTADDARPYLARSGSF